jgi:shikimate kinase
MPGGGKSTVGRQLAKRLVRQFVDTDAVIEQRIGCPIRLFFEREGEAAFREIEAEVLAELVMVPNTVLATGGGAVLRDANRRVLRDGTYAIYLRSSPEELFRRLRNDTQRPLLQVPDPLERLRALYAERDPIYRELAHLVMDTGRPSVSALVNMLVMQLELSGVVCAPDLVPPTKS